MLPFCPSSLTSPPCSRHAQGPSGGQGRSQPIQILSHPFMPPPPQSEKRGKENVLMYNHSCGTTGAPGHQLLVLERSSRGPAVPVFDPLVAVIPGQRRAGGGSEQQHSATSEEASCIFNDWYGHCCATRQNTVPVQGKSSEIHWELRLVRCPGRPPCPPASPHGIWGCVLMVDSSLFIITPLHLAGLYLTLPANQNWQEKTGLIAQKRTSKLPSHSEASHRTLLPPCPLGTSGSTSVVRSLLILREGLGPRSVKCNKLYTADVAGLFTLPIVIEKKQLEEWSAPL